jgi:pimeloyl-ACP methyl ester carboxylesterase
MWIRDVETWAAAHRVYAIDVIGEPGFSAPSRPALSSDAYAQWLDDIMQALGVARASFVAVSLGGWVALDFAVRRPDRVDKVVVISPSGVGRQKVGFLFKSLPLMLLGRWGRRKAMALALGNSPARPHAADRDVATLARVIAKHFRYRRERVPVFADEALKRLTMPILAIVGARDSLLDSHGTKRRLEQCAPQATVRLLPGVGHLVRDQATEVLAFLNHGVPVVQNAARIHL